MFLDGASIAPLHFEGSNVKRPKNAITPPQMVHQFTLIEDQMRKFRGRVCHPRLAFQIFIARQHTDARY